MNSLFYRLFFYSFCKVLIYRELSAFLFRLCINRIKRLKKIAKNLAILFIRPIFAPYKIRQYGRI